MRQHVGFQKSFGFLLCKPLGGSVESNLGCCIGVTEIAVYVPVCPILHVEMECISRL